MQSWGINSAIKLLTYSDELLDGKPFYTSSNCHRVKALNREPAGHAFHSAALKLRGCAKEATDNKEDTTDKKVANEKDKEDVPSFDSYNNNNKGKKKSGKQQHDHYALLGLANLRYLATEDQIRKSYREAALKHHPDKLATLLLAEVTEEAKQAKKDAIESHFKLIQEAYEVLMDPTKRKIFDSTDEFDDEVPSDCAPEDFFKVFGPAFKRNARWSVNPRVPDLGDENTPVKDVDSYYNFWYGFKSWREFPEEEEHDLEQAESREDKRWMEKENAKKTQKARKEEYARIRTLVDNAYKKDPRILKRKEDEKAKKQQKKDAKVLAKKKLEEEAAAAIEEEKKRKEEEAKRVAEAAQQQKKAKEKEKKLRSKERSRLRTLSAPVLSQRLLGISVEHVEDLCMSLNTEQLRILCDKMENKEGLKLAKVLKNGNDETESNDDETEVVQVAAKQNGHVETNGFSMVDSVIPTKHLEDNNSTRSETTEQSCGNNKHLEDNNSTRSETTEQSCGNNNHDNSEPVAVTGSDPDGWSAVQERALVQAMKTFPKETNKRWERVAAAVPGKTMNQCKKKFAGLKDIMRSKKPTA